MRRKLIIEWHLQQIMQQKYDLYTFLFSATFCLLNSQTLNSPYRKSSCNVKGLTIWTMTSLYKIMLIFTLFHATRHQNFVLELYLKYKYIHIRTKSHAKFQLNNNYVKAGRKKAWQSDKWRPLSYHNIYWLKMGV